MFESIIRDIILSPGNIHSSSKKENMYWLRQHFFTEQVINLSNSLDEESISVNGFKRRLQTLHTDGLFSKLFKSIWPSGPSQVSGKPLTGKKSLQKPKKSYRHADTRTPGPPITPCVTLSFDLLTSTSMHVEGLS